jgi:hypothetical protein
MTVTLNLRPEVEAGLAAHAQATGMKLEDYLQYLVEKDLSRRTVEGKSAHFGIDASEEDMAVNGATRSTRPAYELPPEEWMRQFKAWMQSHAGNTVVLPDEAMERESIYGDRGR